MTDAKPASRAVPTAGHNGVSAQKLIAIVERMERLGEDRQAVSDDMAAVLAEAKAEGFDNKAIRRLLKRRRMKPHDRENEEAIDDVYLHAVGMARDLPLFRSVEALSVDTAARESVLAALRLLVPDHGQIILTTGGQSYRLWRDSEGRAHSEEYAPPAQGAKQGPATAAPDPSPRRPPKDVPDVDDAGAMDLGRQAARDNVAVVANPFPWDDGRRRQWDAGWREIAGSDGMGPDE